MLRQRSTYRFILVLLIGSIILAACDDGVPSPAPTQQPTTTATTVAPPATQSQPTPTKHAATLPTATGTSAPASGAIATSTVGAGSTAEAGSPSGCPASQLIDSPQDGLGDRLFPGYGNAGYDVRHYTIDLEVEVEHNVISGTATIDALALKDLDSFNLDFTGLQLTRLSIDGQDVKYRRNDEELVVTPNASIATGQEFVIEAWYGGVPEIATTSGSPTSGWQQYDGGTFVAGEPDGASTWFPVNQHPCDKATYTLTITVAKPYVVAAVGKQVSATDNGSTTTYVNELSTPAAPYLVTVNVGDYEEVTDVGPNGLPIRNYFPQDIPQATKDLFKKTPEMIEFFNSTFGAYPHDVYGGIVVDTDLGFALETQTMSMFGTDLNARSITAEETLAHELAHQWFGDAVSLEQWQDIWLNEGFASYAQWLWLEHKSGRRAYEERIQETWDDLKAANAIPPGKPTSSRMFSMGVYLRGGLTLHALRMEIGDDAFFRTLKAYVEKYKYGNASTADFIAIAEQESGQDLQQLFDEWLYQDALPPLPATAPTAQNTGDNLPKLDQGWTQIFPAGDTMCARGGEYSFWVHPGTVNKLMLFFEGGGGCWDAASCAPGSKFFDDTTGAFDNPARQKGIFDLTSDANPLKDYYMVYVPYCTGDVHTGNNVKTYVAADGTEVTIHHNGFVNSNAAVQWAFKNFLDPEQVFVAGCSAGSIGSIIFAPYVMRQYATSQVLQMGDSEAFVFDHPIDIESTYRAFENLPQWIPQVKAIDPNAFVMSDYYAAVAQYFPASTFSQYNMNQDFVQQGFYFANRLPNKAPQPWTNALSASLDAIHAASPNFRSYTSVGTEHCITPTARFYTEQIGGVTFRDWVADLVGGTVPESVKP